MKEGFVRDKTLNDVAYSIANRGRWAIPPEQAEAAKKSRRSPENRHKSVLGNRARMMKGKVTLPRALWDE